MGCPAVSACVRACRIGEESQHPTFPQVRHVKCTVSKLAPPLGGKLEKVSVVLEK